MSTPEPEPEPCPQLQVQSGSGQAWSCSLPGLHQLLTVLTQACSGYSTQVTMYHVKLRDDLKNKVMPGIINEGVNILWLIPIKEISQSRHTPVHRVITQFDCHSLLLVTHNIGHYWTVTTRYTILMHSAYLHILPIFPSIDILYALPCFGNIRLIWFYKQVVDQKWKLNINISFPKPFSCWSL